MLDSTSIGVNDGTGSALEELKRPESGDVSEEINENDAQEHPNVSCGVRHTSDINGSQISGSDLYQNSDEGKDMDQHSDFDSFFEKEDDDDDIPVTRVVQHEDLFLFEAGTEDVGDNTTAEASNQHTANSATPFSMKLAAKRTYGRKKAQSSESSANSNVEAQLSESFRTPMRNRRERQGRTTSNINNNANNSEGQSNLSDTAKSASSTPGTLRFSESVKSRRKNDTPSSTSKRKNKSAPNESDSMPASLMYWTNLDEDREEEIANLRRNFRARIEESGQDVNDDPSWKKILVDSPADLVVLEKASSIYREDPSVLTFETKLRELKQAERLHTIRKVLGPQAPASIAVEKERKRVSAIDSDSDEDASRDNSSDNSAADLMYPDAPHEPQSFDPTESMQCGSPSYMNVDGDNVPVEMGNASLSKGVMDELVALTSTVQVTVVVRIPGLDNDFLERRQELLQALKDKIQTIDAAVELQRQIELAKKERELSSKLQAKLLSRSYHVISETHEKAVKLQQQKQQQMTSSEYIEQLKKRESSMFGQKKSIASKSYSSPQRRKKVQQADGVTLTKLENPLQVLQGFESQESGAPNNARKDSIVNSILAPEGAMEIELDFDEDEDEVLVVDGKLNLAASNVHISAKPKAKNGPDEKKKSQGEGGDNPTADANQDRRKRIMQAMAKLQQDFETQDQALKALAEQAAEEEKLRLMEARKRFVRIRENAQAAIRRGQALVGVETAATPRNSAFDAVLGNNAEDPEVVAHVNAVLSAEYMPSMLRKLLKINRSFAESANLLHGKGSTGDEVTKGINYNDLFEEVQAAKDMLQQRTRTANRSSPTKSTQSASPNFFHALCNAYQKEDEKVRGKDIRKQLRVNLQVAQSRQQAQVEARKRGFRDMVSMGIARARRSLRQQYEHYAGQLALELEDPEERAIREAQQAALYADEEMRDNGGEGESSDSDYEEEDSEMEEDGSPEEGSASEVETTGAPEDRGGSDRIVEPFVRSAPGSDDISYSPMGSVESMLHQTTHQDEITLSLPIAANAHDITAPVANAKTMSSASKVDHGSLVDAGAASDNDSERQEDLAQHVDSTAEAANNANKLHLRPDGSISSAPKQHTLAGMFAKMSTTTGTAGSTESKRRIILSASDDEDGAATGHAQVPNDDDDEEVLLARQIAMEKELQEQQEAEARSLVGKYRRIRKAVTSGSDSDTSADEAATAVQNSIDKETSDIEEDSDSSPVSAEQPNRHLPPAGVIIDDEDLEYSKEQEAIRRAEEEEYERQRRLLRPKTYAEMLLAEQHEMRQKGEIDAGRGKYVDREAELSEEEADAGLGAFGVQQTLIGAEGKIIRKLVEEAEEREAVGSNVDVMKELEGAIVEDLSEGEEESERLHGDLYAQQTAAADAKLEADMKKALATGKLSLLRRRQRKDGFASFARDAVGIAEDEDEAYENDDDEERLEAEEHARMEEMEDIRGEDFDEEMSGASDGESLGDLDELDDDAFEKALARRRAVMSNRSDGSEAPKGVEGLGQNIETTFKHLERRREEISKAQLATISAILENSSDSDNSESDDEDGSDEGGTRHGTNQGMKGKLSLLTIRAAPTEPRTSVLTHPPHATSQTPKPTQLSMFPKEVSMESVRSNANTDTTPRVAGVQRVYGSTSAVKETDPIATTVCDGSKGSDSQENNKPAARTETARIATVSPTNVAEIDAQKRESVSFESLSNVGNLKSLRIRAAAPPMGRTRISLAAGQATPVGTPWQHLNDSMTPITQTNQKRFPSELSMTVHAMADSRSGTTTRTVGQSSFASLANTRLPSFSGNSQSIAEGLMGSTNTRKGMFQVGKSTAISTTPSSNTKTPTPNATHSLDSRVGRDNANAKRSRADTSFAAAFAPIIGDAVEKTRKPVFENAPTLFMAVSDDIDERSGQNMLKRSRIEASTKD